MFRKHKQQDTDPMRYPVLPGCAGYFILTFGLLGGIGLGMGIEERIYERRLEHASAHRDDVNGDGHQDIVLEPQQGKPPYVFYGQEDGTYKSLWQILEEVEARHREQLQKLPEIIGEEIEESKRKSEEEIERILGTYTGGED